MNTYRVREKKIRFKRFEHISYILSTTKSFSLILFLPSFFFHKHECLSVNANTYVYISMCLIMLFFFPTDIFLFSW